MLHTHYDNLKIARDAPIEVVRAAYRALSLLYHPDRNPGDPEAERNMALINAAYEVLSDPDRKLEYDESIGPAEAATRPQPKHESDTRPYIGMPRFRRSREDNSALPPQERWRNYGVWSAVTVVSILMAVGAFALYRAQDVPHSLASLAVAPVEAPSTRQSAASEAQQLWRSMGSGAVRTDPSSTTTSSTNPEATTRPEPAPATPTDSKKSAASNASREPPAPKRVVRHDEGHPYSDAASNGERWPQASGYVHGFPILNADGGSQLVIDNTKNNFDVFLKLVALTGNEPKSVRSIFVLAHGQFTARRIDSGTYEARYRQLKSGALMKSATFVFDETAIAGGTRYSIVTLEVHAAPDESANAYSLSEEEFDQ